MGWKVHQGSFEKAVGINFVYVNCICICAVGAFAAHRMTNRFDYKRLAHVFAKKMGYSEEELINTNYLELVKEDYRNDIKEFYLQQYINRISETYHEFPTIAKDGKIMFVNLEKQKEKVENDP